MADPSFYSLFIHDSLSKEDKKHFDECSKECDQSFGDFIEKILKRCDEEFHHSSSMKVVAIGMSYYEFLTAPSNLNLQFKREELIIKVIRDMIKEGEYKRLKEIYENTISGRLSNCSLELVWRFT